VSRPGNITEYASKCPEGFSFNQVLRGDTGILPHGSLSSHKTDKKNLWKNGHERGVRTRAMKITKACSGKNLPATGKNQR
jgi:hypothetical protein